MARKYQVSIDLKTNADRKLAQLDSQLKKVEKSFGGFGKATGAVNATRSALGRVAALSNPYAIAAAGAAALTTAAFGAVAGASALNKQLLIAEERTGIAAERLSEWEAVLKQVSEGADFEDLQEAVLNVSERFGEAAQDAGAIRDALNALGFDNQEIIDLSQLGTAEEQFLAFADSVKDLPPAELTFRLREIGAEDLLRVKELLQEIGGDGGEAARKVAALDLALSGKAIANLTEYSKQAKLTGLIFKDIASEVGGGLAPLISSILETFNLWVEALGGTETIVNVLVGAFNVIVSPIRAASEILQALLRSIIAVKEIILNLGPQIKVFITDKFEEARQAVVRFIESIPGGDAVLNGIEAAGEAAGQAADAVGGFAATAGTALASVGNAIDGQIQSWRGNEQAAEAAFAASERQADAVRGGTVAVRQMQAAQEATAQAATEAAQAQETVANAISNAEAVFSSTLKQANEKFGVKLDTQTAQQALEDLDAKYAELRSSFVDDQVDLLIQANPNINTDELLAAETAFIAEFEAKFGAAYDRTTRELTAQTRLQVDQFEKLAAGYDKYAKARFDSEAKIAQFKAAGARGEITGPEVAELIELEEKASAERLKGLKAADDREVQARADKLKRQEEVTAKEVAALAKARSILLAEVNQFGAIDVALEAQLQRINDAFGAGTQEAQKLTLVAELEAEINRDQLTEELARLEATAADVTKLEIPVSVTNANGAVSELQNIFSQIETERQEAEANFQATFKFDPNAGAALADNLNRIDASGAEAYARLFEQLGDFEVIGDINLADGLEDELAQLEAPIANLKRQLSDAIGAGDVEQQRRIQLLIETVEDQGLKDLVKATEDGFSAVTTVSYDKGKSNIDEVLEEIKKLEDTTVEVLIKAKVDPALAKAAAGQQATGAEASAVGSAISGFSVGEGLFEQGGLDKSFEQVQNLRDRIDALKLKGFDTTDLEAGLENALDRVGNLFTGKFEEIVGGINSAGEGIGTAFGDQLRGAFGDKAGTIVSGALDTVLPVFGQFYSERAEKEQAQLQQSVAAFQVAEQEKVAFAQVQEDFRAANSQSDVDNATENLNRLLEQYNVTNDELAALGLARGASAQQIAAVVAGASQSESDALKKQAQQQEAIAKKAFEADKNFKRASVIASGIEAVMSAYAFGSRIGGPIGGGIAAGLAGAFALKQLSAINSLSFQGSAGALSGSGAGGGSGIAQAGDTGSTSGIGQVDTAADSIGGGRSVANIKIDFQGRSSVTTDEAIDMVQAIKEAAAEGFDVDFENV